MKNCVATVRGQGETRTRTSIWNTMMMVIPTETFTQQSYHVTWSQLEYEGGEEEHYVSATEMYLY